MPKTGGTRGEHMKKVRQADTGKRVWFEFFAEPTSLVYVAGTFNNWDPTANPLKDNPDSGHFKAALRIPPGTHEYKFVVNGIWAVDPKCPHRAPNSYGSMNSVIHV